MRLIKDYLNYQDYKTQIFYFLPGEEVKKQTTFAIFCHGYTADKSSILNWALRLVESGVSCALFDLPGHYLGNFSEVTNFSHFKNHAHELFGEAYLGLSKKIKIERDFEMVLGGHSLGAMLAFKALTLPLFEKMNKRAIGVGIGMAPKHVVHIFDTPFYKNTLLVREQLVSSELRSENVFPWIKSEKENMLLANQKLHLITGADDLVVGEDGMERFCEALMAKNNLVTFQKPAKLPHHEPQLAAPHIKKYLKDSQLIL